VKWAGIGLVHILCLVDRGRDMRFAQEDNLLVGWRVEAQLAVCSTQVQKSLTRP
jgi:hypothetical protein